MPGAKSRIKPLSAGDSSGSSASNDEGSQLELHLQRQLEEDVARIFDESIYSDLEVVCGKLKILTHSCILKARTHNFYHKLEAILHVNIGRKTFDEIYSFISDVYTECNIHQQEKEIIKYLNENLNLVNNVAIINNPNTKPEEKDEAEVYSTPNCVSPEERASKKAPSSSPSTELTKEYYALVPIDGNILDKELIEQDALSNAFQSINKSQIDLNDKQNKQCVKPTSLFLYSSHISNTKKHSKSCDILRDSDLKIADFIKNIDSDENKTNNATSQIRKNIKKSVTDNKTVDIFYKKSNLTETCVDKVVDPTYSPDSLVTDEPSSSSDYLSAAYAVSPGAVSASGFSQLNVGENATKMENIITVSDSGLETTGMPESLNSNKDVTLTDVSLTESTFHDMVNEDANWQDSTSSTLDKSHIPKIKRSTSLNSPISGTSTGKVLQEERHNKRSLTEMSGTSTKEEKQRQNEEIVILESSSLSSETGSWESVFPPKLGERELCEKFITSERHNALVEEPGRPHQTPNIHRELHDELCPSLVQKSPFKSTSCFIDAATLVDEDESKEGTRPIKILPESSRAVSCAVKRDQSPKDWSEGNDNDNDDSLEQEDNKDPDSIQKDLSPTIFEMTPITEDSLCGNTFETVNDVNQKHPGADSNINTKNSEDGMPNIATSTSNNLTTAGGGYDYNVQASEISVNDPKAVRRDNNAHTPLFDLCSRVSHTPQETFVDGDKVLLKSYESSTISAASVEDHFSQLGNNHSPLTKRTIENIPVVMSGAFTAEAKESSITGNSLSGNRFETVIENQVHSTAAYDSNTEINTNKSGDALALRNIASSTPNNSIISVATGGADYKKYASELGENDITKATRRDNNSHTPLFDLCSNVYTQENFVKDCNKVFFKNNDSPIISGGASVEDHLPQLGNSHRGSPLTKRKIENIPIVSGAYIISEAKEITEKTVKTSADSFWVVDMSSTSNPNVSASNNELAVDKATIALRSSSKSKSREVSANSVENCKSRSSVDSDSSEKSTHKFYIDLATLPDTLTPEKKHDVDDNNEKKNIFSMFIDLGNKAATVKEMPPRLSSSLNTKKSSKLEIKRTTIKGSKTTKPSSLTCVPNVNHTDDSLLFEKLESLCNDPSLSISEIISNPGSHTEDTTEFSESVKANDLSKIMIEQKSDYDESMDLFVKLSDLDKPIPKVEPPTLSSKKESNERMTRSIPDNDWRESTQTINTRSSEIISSFHSENALSLNRLFPHLKNDFSRSVPGYLSSRTKSPMRLGISSNGGDLDEQASDMSEMSSVQSSYCRSVVENSTTEETDQTSSLISNCQSRLGQDLLRMFLEEIAPDVIVEAAGRRIKAHKCILSSRCQYFAGILSGGWVESAGNVIALPPFSFNVVHFALCHIYSGVSMIPDSISIVELATIADMLGLEGLKEAIMFTLKSKYCHHFHKPCTVCTAGALECFPLSSVYGLDDLYRKCLRWITKHFHKVWPTKAFATLPSELLDKCYQEHIVNLSTDNIVETVYGCGITVASLQNSRWCDIVARMCRRLENAAAHFAATRLGAVLRATAALTADAPPPAAQALDDCMAAAIEWAPPDEACRAYAFLSVLVREIRARLHAKPDLISSGAQPEAVAPESLLHSRAPGWRLQCEGALVRAAPRVVGTQAFKDLPVDLRKRLRELGCIMFGAQAMPVSPSPLMQRKTRSAHCGRPSARAHNAATSRSLDIDRVRASFVPYTPKPPPQVGSVDLLPVRDARLPKSNKTLPPSVRTTKAQEERAKYNLIKTNQSQDRLNCKPTARAVFENTKPRYLEPRQPKEEKRLPLRKPQPKMVSSSESSRNSSPNQVRRAPPRAAASRDSLAASRPRTADPSTDSLSESQNSNKYATYTKAKHTTKGSVESVVIQPSKCQLLSTSMNNKAKATKIPVFVKQNSNSKTRTAVSVTSREVQRRVQTDKSVASSLSPVAQPRNRANERKPSGSLMNATKSSQAKMVPKIVKETHNTKCANRPDKHLKCGKHPSPLSPPAQEIPIMERSGTFLKDEPMFGDKTTNIDIDE